MALSMSLAKVIVAKQIDENQKDQIMQGLGLI